MAGHAELVDNVACLSRFQASKHNQSQPIAALVVPKFCYSLLMVLASLLLIGCGGEEKTAEKPATSKAPANKTAPPVAEKETPEEPESDAEDPAAAESDPETEAGTDAEADTEPAGEAEVGEEAATDADGKGDDKKESKKASPDKKEATKPAPPKRPKELEKWKKDDYLAAKRDGDRDRNLEAAVVLMGDKFAGDARAAGLFKELLAIEIKPAEKKPDGKPGRDIEIKVQASVADALVKALAKNKTPEATTILKELLFSKFKTPLAPRATVNNVLGEMARYSEYPEYEDFLFGLLTDPQATLNGEVLIPDDPLPNARIQSELFGILGTTTTPAFNLRLARHLEDPSIPKDLATQIESMLIRDRPETLSAKRLLYQNEQSESRTKTASEAALVAHSETALSILLGLPPKMEDFPAPGAVSRPTARQKGYSDEQIAAELAFATESWVPDFDQFLMQKIAKKDSLEEMPGPLQLIGIMPTHFARFSMSELMAMYSAKGPRSWVAAGLMGRATSDPAFVIQAKSIYHNASRRVSRVDPNDKRPAPDQETRDEWRDGMDPLVQGWIKRFYSAGRNSTAENWTAAKESGNFNVALHKDANVVTEYHLVWPGEAQSQIPGVVLAPLEVHYVRIEEEAVPDKLASHYKRFGASGPNAPKRTVRNGSWFDNLSNGVTPKSKRSVDIIISHKPIPEVKSTPGVVQETKPIQVVVDILTIEAPEAVKPAEK